MGKRHPAAWAVFGLSLSLATACASAEKPTETTKPALSAEEIAAKQAERETIARADPLTQAAYWQEEYKRDPADRTIIIAFSRALRTIGSHEEALEALGKGLALYPDDTDMLLIAARALISLNRLTDAEKTYARLQVVAPDNPAAWAGMGIVLDQTGRHNAAQVAYRRALALDPSRQSTMSNLAMSYALSGDPVQAEALLREALAMNPGSLMVRQNLALVVGLQGRFDEMKEIAGKDLPDSLNNANVEVIRAMLTPSRDWSALESEGSR